MFPETIIWRNNCGDTDRAEHKTYSNIDLRPFYLKLTFVTNYNSNIFYLILFSIPFLKGEKKRRSGELKATFEPGISESWYVTPPSCFEGSPVEVEANPFEDLLIEHPSMSVYGPRTRSQTRSSSRENSEGQQGENQAVSRRQNRRTVQFQAHLELIERRRQVEPPKVARHCPNKKHMKRQNKVHFQQSHSRRTKKRDRMVGKHIGLHGKRGG